MSPSPQLAIFGRKEKKSKHTYVSASSNPSYAKKRCTDVRFQKLNNIFSEIQTFLSYGHCLVPWCPDKGGFTVGMSGDEWGELAGHKRSLTHHTQISRLGIQCHSGSFLLNNMMNMFH